MRALVNKKVAVIITGVAVLAGAGGAIAATQSSAGSLGQAYLNDLANRLGVSPSTLTTDMKAALEDQINAAVTAGRISQAKANALKQRIEQTGPLLGLGRVRFGLGLRGTKLGAAAAAQYLGSSEATLRSDLASGKSLAQITASIPGKSPTGL